LSAYQRRALVIPIGKRKDGSVRVFDFGIPATALNELPVTTSGGDLIKAIGIYGKELGQYGTGLLGPFPKIPIELATGQDTFRRLPIEPEGRTLVPAPSWLGVILPEGAEKKLGLTTIKDPKTGKRVPGWPAKNAYLLRQAMPGPLGQGNQLLTEGTNKRGQAQGKEKTASVLSGLKVGYTDKITQDTTRIFKELDIIAKQKGDLSIRELKLGKDGYATPAYQRLLDREKLLNKEKDRLYKAAGRPEAIKLKRRPLTPAQEVAKDLEEYRKASSPAAAKQEVLDEIAEFKQQNGGR